jgi:hypothetical protein
VFGRWADNAEGRLQVVFIGCGMQAFTSTAAILLLALLLLNDTSSNDAGFSLILFILLCLCGIIENTGAGIVSVAVEKDWVPTVFEGFSGAAAATSAVDDNGDDEEGKKDDLTQINANMARIDLIAEFAGPVMAGLVLSFFDENTLAGFGAIGIFNALTFVPQYYLLSGIHGACARLRQPSKPAETPPAAAADAAGEKTALVGAVEEGGGAGGGCLGGACGMSGWAAWYYHPGGVPFVSVSYALLYFFILSPHGIPMTAYLASIGGVSPTYLACFRGAGALSGVAGLWLFEIAKKGAGLRRASLGHLLFEALAVFVACWFFTSNLTVFMAAVVASRVGLYGFDVGFMELQQRQVEERHRNAVGQVDNALTSVGTLLMYLASLSVDSADSFESLSWVSAGAVGTAAMVFMLYLFLWHEHTHYHDADPHRVSGDFLGHAHTTQQRRSLELSLTNTHKHVHYAGPQVLSAFFGGDGGGDGGGAEGLSDVGGHDHSHDHGHSHSHA